MLLLHIVLMQATLFKTPCIEFGVALDPLVVVSIMPSGGDVMKYMMY